VILLYCFTHDCKGNTFSRFHSKHFQALQIVKSATD
jgi:hypothetical protein